MLVIACQCLLQLPAVWFSWEELFTAMEIPIRNNTIVTVNRRKKNTKNKSFTYRKACNTTQVPQEGAKPIWNVSAAWWGAQRAERRRGCLCFDEACVMSACLSAEQLKSLWDICLQPRPVRPTWKSSSVSHNLIFRHQTRRGVFSPQVTRTTSPVDPVDLTMESSSNSIC